MTLESVEKLEVYHHQKEEEKAIGNNLYKGIRAREVLEDYRYYQKEVHHINFKIV